MTLNDDSIPTRSAVRARRRANAGLLAGIGHPLLEASTIRPEEAVAMSTDAGNAGPVWIQVAKQGEWRGHQAGPFKMNLATFTEIIRNQASTNQPIPVDFEHASEAPASSGSIPSQGAPAQGWITKLEVRGDGNLWGLVEWGELARQYIREGKYRFLSPAIVFGARDRVTGKSIGARLSSVALTNQPFLAGMQPVAAKNTNASDAAPGGEPDADESAPGAECSNCARLTAKVSKMKRWKARAKVAEAALAESNEAATASLVDEAIRVHRLDAGRREALLALCSSNPKAFAASYPHVAPQHQHLLRMVAADDRRDVRDLIGAGPRPTKDDADWGPQIARLMKDEGVTLEQAIGRVYEREVKRTRRAAEDGSTGS